MHDQVTVKRVSHPTKWQQLYHKDTSGVHITAEMMTHFRPLHRHIQGESFEDCRNRIAQQSTGVDW